MRAVVDPNVVISALLSPLGSPARVLARWIDGDFELIVSEALVAELERALAYPKLRRRVTAAETAELVALLRAEGDWHDDPSDPPMVRSPDPGDDYLVALAVAARAVIVSGDSHLLGLAKQIPVYAPAGFLALLDAS